VAFCPKRIAERYGNFTPSLQTNHRFPRADGVVVDEARRKLTSNVKGMLRMFGADFIIDPYPTYALLRKSAPIHWVREFGSGTWLIPGYEGVATALQEPRLSSRRTHRLLAQYSTEQRAQLSDFHHHFSKWIVFLDPPRHSVWRRLISKGFTAKVVAQARPRISALVNRLIDRGGAERKMDFIRDFARPLPAITMVEFLGVDPSDHDDVIGWTDDIANFFGNANSPIQVAHAAQSAISSLSEHFKHMLDVRRADPRDDLVSLLLQATEEDDDFATPDELAAQCSALLFAGHETTRMLLGNGLYALINNPEQFALLQKNPSLVPSAVKEFARFDAPVQLNSRVVAAPFEMYGHELKEGQIVTVMLGSAQRDPEAFDNPDQLDVTRRGAPSLSFGKGAHYCIGAALASLEAEIAFSTIMERMANVRLAVQEVRWVNNIYFRGLQSLPVEF
jgi:cytochrome P450